MFTVAECLQPDSKYMWALLLWLGMWIPESTCANVKVKGQHWGAVPQVPSTFYFKKKNGTGSLAGLQQKLSGFLTSQLRGSAYLCLSEHRNHKCELFKHEFWGSNSGPRACKIRTSPREPSPQAPKQAFNRDFYNVWVSKSGPDLYKYKSGRLKFSIGWLELYT